MGYDVVEKTELTSRNKFIAAIANLKTWFQEQLGLPKKILFGKLNRKLIGSYNY